METLSYQIGIRNAYLNTTAFKNDRKTRNIEIDTYSLYIRPEEVTNGKLPDKYYGDTQYKVPTQNNELTKEERLKVYVTYKVSIKNQAQTPASVIEVVDYFDKKYTYIEAYIGDANGTKQGNVTKSDISKYGTQSQYTSSEYNTVYLRPDQINLQSGNELYIYVKFQISEDVQEVLKDTLLNGNTLNTNHLVEINGYKSVEGAVDIDSIPGNANTTDVTKLLQRNNVKNIYEDDINLSPQMKFTLTTNSDNKINGSRTIEGVVFEDATGKDEKVYIGEKREGDGILQATETKIAGVIVQLVETKTGKAIAQTRTNSEGWYGFIGFIPGDYKIRYIYGYDDQTAMTNNPPKGVNKGLNKKSYNGQEYKATKYKAKNSDYWYTIEDSSSDARDDETRRNKVMEYSQSVVNHKAEVFSSYKNPQPNHINDIKTRELANELEEQTHGYADTEIMNIEIEYATKSVNGNKIYEHKIKGVDFGLVERPRTKLEIDQEIESVKVILANGVEYIDTDRDLKNIQWIKNKKTNKDERVISTIDEELMHGAKIEIKYGITVSNKGETDATSKTKASNIVNYVSNNLSYDEKDNLLEEKPLWDIVATKDIQNNSKETLINKTIDLSSQVLILKASNDNPLVNKWLSPGESTSSTITVKKVITAESLANNEIYTNMAEIVEIGNEEGRYNNDTIPGNQALDLQPQEYDTAGASQSGSVDNEHPQDGTVSIIPPTGTKHIYHIIGILIILMSAIGIYIIKIKKKMKN